MSDDVSVPVLMTLAVDMYCAYGPGCPLKDHCPGGVWEHEWQDGGVKYRARLNGTGDEKGELMPWGAVIYGNGWPIALFNPGGGSVMMTTERELEDVLRRHISAASN